MVIDVYEHAPDNRRTTLVDAELVAHVYDRAPAWGAAPTSASGPPSPSDFEYVGLTPTSTDPTGSSIPALMGDGRSAITMTRIPRAINPRQVSAKAATD